MNALRIATTTKDPETETARFWMDQMFAASQGDQEAFEYLRQFDKRLSLPQRREKDVLRLVRTKASVLPPVPASSDEYPE